jgi:CHASE3 domain sensor protein
VATWGKELNEDYDVYNKARRQLNQVKQLEAWILRFLERSRGYLLVFLS